MIRGVQPCFENIVMQAASVPAAKSVQVVAARIKAFTKVRGAGNMARLGLGLPELIGQLGSSWCQ